MTQDPTPPRDAQRRRLIGATLGAGAMGAIGALPALARAQAPFPSRPITLVVPFAPAGIADATARTVAEAMAKDLGQPIVVDNRPSAGSIVATQALLSAPADGHTWLLMSNSHAVSVGLFRKLPYDTLKDLLPVSTLGVFDLAVFVASNSRFKSMTQLLQEAKAKPGQLRMGTIAVGTTQHLAARLLETVAGVEFLSVPYKSSPAVLMALRSGEIDLSLEILGPMMSQLQAGVVKALALTAEQRHPLLPDVPTLREAGVSGGEVSSWNAIAVRAGTPAPIVERINKAARDAMTNPAVLSKLTPLGLRAQAGTPAQSAELLARETRRWGEVIRKAGITPE